MILESQFQLSPPTSSFHETILDRCLAKSKEDPEAKAFINSEDETKFVTFGQIYDRAAALSQWLIGRGYKKGDVLMVFMHNSWQMVVTCLGAWSAGLIVTLASSQFTHYELNYQLLDSTASIVVTNSKLLPVLEKAQDKVKLKDILCMSAPSSSSSSLVHELEEIMLSPHSGYKPVALDLDKDLIVLPYSSGTTGTPKGVMISHLNYAYMLQGYVRKYDEDFKAMGFEKFIPPAHSIIFLPFYHAMGVFSCFFALHNCTTQIVMEKFNLKRFLQHIQDYGVFTITLVPAIVLLLAESPLLDSYDLSSVGVIACGSAPLSESVAQKLRKKLPDVTFAQGYGMTEMSVASHIGSLKAPQNSVGKLMPGTKMKVISENGSLCGPNVPGEMWIKGPQVMKGYWRKEAQSKEVLDADGFMRTGDIVYYDEEGNTFICDRIKELIKVKGKQVPPAELEAVLLEHPDVNDACVIGIPDEASGELPRAYIVSSLKNENAIHKFINEKVAPYKRLAGGIEFLATIPRTSTGKMLRRQLRDEFMKKNKARL